jgi:MFS superfamily sulfate permease-like transporter
LWKTNKIDFAAWFGCLAVCLSVGVEIGLIFGILISVLHLFLSAARPKISIYVEKVNFTILILL